MKSIFPFIILFLMDCGFSLSCLGTTNPKWEACHFTRDQAPINLSHLLDAPAGKHGFLDIRNKRFVFEDGTPARFWGTTMAGAACFPPQDKAPLLAERLSRMGFNLVRFEHMDATWANPS
ncbi:hypothetical protein GF373_13180, partial [bacterium]|nr:hypothetical protein [bacterium]